MQYVCMRTYVSGFFAGISEDTLTSFRTRFESDPKNLLAQNVCVKNNVLDVMRKRQSETAPHVYSHKVMIIFIR